MDPIRKRLSEKSTLGAILTTAITFAGLHFGLSPEMSLGIAAAIVGVVPEEKVAE